MIATELEKLKKLKDSGVLSEKEFLIEKKKILESTETAQPDSKPQPASNDGVGIVIAVVIGIIVVAVAVSGGFPFGSHVNFACDNSSMKFAEDLINKNYANFNNSFRLSNPSQVQYSGNHIRCRANTNFYREFPEIYYDLDKQSDGSILVQVNPIGDRMKRELNRIQQELDREMRQWERDMRFNSF